ncbi:MAG: hypothetical protein V7K67_20300 [Nostoc sp.]|uniref:hypothetical protein n=1 Tax=Nostoc sp. TaxID=1180 RepID=UPI002FEEDD27
MITDALAKVSLEDFLTAICCQRRQTEPHGKRKEEIESLPLFDGDMKDRLEVEV